MSAQTLETCSPWQRVSGAIDRAAQVMVDIPCFYGYELAPESELDLNAAAVLVQRALAYLHGAAAREAPRLRALEKAFEARGEQPPWQRDSGKTTEDGD